MHKMLQKVQVLSEMVKSLSSACLFWKSSTVKCKKKIILCERALKLGASYLK